MSIKNTKMRKMRPQRPPFNPHPDKDSKRSKRRRNRGFKDLLSSSRKHRRAERRLAIAQTIANKRYPAGETITGAYSQDDFAYHSGGRLNYHV